MPEPHLRLFGVRLFDKYREKELRASALVAKLVALQLSYLSLTDLRTILASAGSVIVPANTPPRAKG
ncbi:MAG: hypothetical protein B7X34_05215 [Acidobacteriia bacterium 12-62-4]|nr:MAG: hypothetical protein B7X34_05215 [Acidobacteriia bacterium 12-62-4]